MASKLFIKQILLGDMQNFSYIIADNSTCEAFVIDPSGDWQDIVKSLKEESLTLKAVLLTHGHYDHVVGVEKVDVPVYLSSQEAFFYTPHAKHMIRSNDGDKIPLGTLFIECLHTPGHTPGCQSFLVEGNLFTGDTLFIEAIGRTDFPGGSADVMFESLACIKRLPEATIVWPGHDYGRVSHASLLELKKINPYFASNDKASFLEFF